MWDTLLIALALFFVIEGLLPTLNPGGYRRAMEMVAQMSDRAIRSWGLFSMIVGLVLLYIFNR